MNKGFMFLPREIRNWGWYRDSKMIHMLIHLMLEAQYQDVEYMGIKLKRGQLVTGRKKLSEETGLTEREVRTAIKRLENDQQIKIETTNRYSIITLCNYDSWQNIKISNDQQMTIEPTNKRPTNDHIQINKEDNIKEKDINISKKKALNYPDEFNSDWNLYDRKGSKKDSFTAWKSLSDEDKQRMRNHIPHYIHSNDRQYLKDFERYIKHRTFDSPVYKGSVLLYDPMKNDNPEEYHPLTDDIFQTWNEERKCLRFNGDLAHLNDGYTDDNRPDGAMVSWGMYSWKWNKVKKQWIDS